MRNRILKCLILLFSIATLLLTFSAFGCGSCNNTNDVYYLYENNEFVQGEYIRLFNGGNAHINGGQVKYKIEGEIITFTMADGTVVSGTYVDKVITVNEKVYKIKGDKDANGNRYTSDAKITQIAGGTIDESTKKALVDVRTDSFDFNQNLTISLTATYKVYKNNELIKSKIATELTNGDNTFKVVVKSGDWSTEYIYTVVVHKIYVVDITYYSDNVLYHTEQVETHTTLDEGPIIENKVGYEFSTWGSLGWYVQGAKRFDAVWISNTYYVAYNGNGSTSGAMPNSTHKYGKASPLSANAFVKEGYVFAGWATSADGNKVYDNFQNVSTLTAEKNGTVTLYALWSPARYTVRYNGNGNTGGSTSNSTHYYNTAKNLTANGFTKTGYHFIGWSKTAGGSVNYTNTQSVLNLSKIHGDIIDVYAVWELNKYNVAYNGNGSTSGNMLTDTNILYGESYTVKVNTYTKTGYTYQGGWSTTANGAIAYTDNQKTSNLTGGHNVTVTLYAKWQANNYTVTFNANGGSGTMPNQEFTYDVQQTLTANAFTYTGKHFVGWALTPDGSKVYNDNASVKNLTATDGAKVNLYAVWENNVYRVNYIGNGNTGGSTHVSYHTYNTASPLTTNGFTKTGYSFVGWAESADGNVKYTNGANILNLTTEHNAVIDLYAKWQANNYTVAYNGNGNTSGSTANTSATYDVEFSLSACGYQKEGYTFIGWSTTESGTKVYNDGANVKNLTAEPNGVFVLYAVWAANEYVVEFNSNGGEGTMQNQNFTYDVAQTLSANTFANSGYHFGGWMTSNDGEVLYADSAEVINLTPTNDGVVVLYAKWDKDVTRIILTNELVLVPNKLTKLTYEFGSADENAIGQMEYILTNNTANARIEGGCLITEAIDGGNVSVQLQVDGVQSDVYTFEVAVVLSTVEDVMNMSLDGIYTLNGDIDMTGVEFAPIGSSSINADGSINYDNAFKGHFNGNGYAIKGLNIDLSTSTGATVGLFGAVAEEGIVENLKITNAVVSGTVTDASPKYIGIGVGASETAINNVVIENATINLTIAEGVDEVYIGGVVGSSESVLNNITTNVNINVSCPASCDLNVDGIAGDCKYVTNYTIKGNTQITII